MESIISALCTPNEILIRNTNFIFIALEAVVSMLLFTTVLNVKASSKTKVIYIIVLSLLLNIIIFLFPQFKFLVTIITFLCIYKFFNLTILKTFIACLIQFVITIILELLYSVISNVFLSIPYSLVAQIPIGVIVCRFTTYIIELSLYYFAKKINFNIEVLDNITSASKRILLCNLFVGILFMLLEISMFNYYYVSLPSYIALINLLAIISYFVISIYSLIKTSNLESANQRIENLELYNKTLNLLHDNIRAFKHDFNNIIQAIGRICCYQ